MGVKVIYDVFSFSFPPFSFSTSGHISKRVDLLYISTLQHHGMYTEVTLHLVHRKDLVCSRTVYAYLRFWLKEPLFLVAH